MDRERRMSRCEMKINSSSTGKAQVMEIRATIEFNEKKHVLGITQLLGIGPMQKRYILCFGEAFVRGYPQIE